MHFGLAQRGVKTLEYVGLVYGIVYDTEMDLNRIWNGSPTR
jgi:hypothetical protein